MADITIAIQDADGKEVHKISATDLKALQTKVREELEGIEGAEKADEYSEIFFTNYGEVDMSMKDFLALNEGAEKSTNDDKDTDTEDIEFNLDDFAQMMGEKGKNPMEALAGLFGNAGKDKKAKDEGGEDNSFTNLLEALRESELNKKIQMGIAMASMLNAGKEKSPLDQVAIDFAVAEGLEAIMEFMKVQAMSPEEKKGLDLKIIIAFVAKHLGWPMHEAVGLSDMIAAGLRTIKIASLKKKLSDIRAVESDPEIRNLEAEIATAKADKAIAGLVSERDAMIKAGFTPEFVEKYFIERMIAETKAKTN